MEGLHAQVQATRKAIEDEKQRQAALDKHQITTAVARDEVLLEIERKKVEERARLGKQWMKNAED